LSFQSKTKFYLWGLLSLRKKLRELWNMVENALGFPKGRRKSGSAMRTSPSGKSPAVCKLKNGEAADQRMKL